MELKTSNKVFMEVIQLQMEQNHHTMVRKMCPKSVHQKYCRVASGTLHFRKAHRSRYVFYFRILCSIVCNGISSIQMSTNKMNRLPFVLPSE